MSASTTDLLLLEGSVQSNDKNKEKKDQILTYLVWLLVMQINWVVLVRHYISRFDISAYTLIQQSYFICGAYNH